MSLLAMYEATQEDCVLLCDSRVKWGGSSCVLCGIMRHVIVGTNCCLPTTFANIADERTRQQPPSAITALPLQQQHVLYNNAEGLAGRRYVALHGCNSYAIPSAAGIWRRCRCCLCREKKVKKHVTFKRHYGQVWVSLTDYSVYYIPLIY